MGFRESAHTLEIERMKLYLGVITSFFFAFFAARRRWFFDSFAFARAPGMATTGAQDPRGGVSSLRGAEDSTSSEKMLGNGRKLLR